MTIVQLQYVAAVHELGSFFEAAKKCFVTQPTISQQIKKLEDQLGAEIFDRGKKPIGLTPLGEKIIAQAHRILAEAKQLRDIVGAETQSLAGDLRVAVIPTLAPYILPDFVARVRDQLPLIRLEVEELQTDEIVRRLQQDRLDLGILVTPLAETQIVERPLFYEPFYVYYSEGHPLAKKTKVSENELAVEDMYILSQGHCLRNQMLKLCQRRPAKGKSGGTGVRFESGSLQTLKSMVDKAGGYTLLPHLARRDLLTSKENDRVLEFVQPVPVREVSLVTHKNFGRHQLLDRIEKLLLETIPGEIKKGKAKSEVISIL